MWSTARSIRSRYDLLKDLDPVALLPANPQLIVTKTERPGEGPERAGRLGEGEPGEDHRPAPRARAAPRMSRRSISSRRPERTTPFVPYRGTGPAILDLIAGQIDIMIDQSSNSLPHVRGGKLRAFAVTAAKRLPSAPDIPSVDEAGLPGFYISVWHGLWVPKGTPKEAIEQAHRGRAGGARRSGGAEAPRPSLAWKSRRASSRRRKACARIRRPKSRSGGRSSRRLTSRGNKRRRDAERRETPQQEEHLLGRGGDYASALRSRCRACVARGWPCARAKTGPSRPCASSSASRPARRRTSRRACRRQVRAQPGASR